MGYANKLGNDKTSSMKRMMCATFLQIDAKDADGNPVEGMYLSQLKFDGYQDVEYFQSEGLSGFRVVKLTATGGEEANYLWEDEYDEDSEKWSGGRWYHLESEKYIGDDGEPDLLLGVGDALWCYLPKKRTGSDGYTFCNAGEVLIDSQEIPVNTKTSSRKFGFGNMMNAATVLSKVAFNGYQNVEYFQSEGLSGFRMIKLTSTGGEDANYVWEDEYDEDSEKWSGGVWYHLESEKYIGQDGEPDLEIQPGDALWCYAPKVRTGTKAYTVKYPGLNAK